MHGEHGVNQALISDLIFVSNHRVFPTSLFILDFLLTQLMISITILLKLPVPTFSQLPSHSVHYHLLITSTLHTDTHPTPSHPHTTKLTHRLLLEQMSPVTMSTRHSNCLSPSLREMSWLLWISSDSCNLSRERCTKRCCCPKSLLELHITFTGSSGNS